MAREAKAIPKAWQDIGVWYVVNVDDQHALVDELERIAERERSGEQFTSQEQRRAVDLREKTRDLFAAKILPYSGDEYARLEGARMAAAVSVSVDGRGHAKVGKIDAKAITREIALDVIELRVRELRGYSKTEATRTDHETGEVLETRTTPIKTGAELVAFLRSPGCPDSEMEVAWDLFEAIKNQSHLEVGLGKWSASRRASSPATTRLLAGDAPAAIPTTSTPGPT